MGARAMLIVAGAVLGAIVGSFLATLVLRWPAGRSVAAGRSTCDACGEALPAYRLIPILSWLGQRGRAACCGARIDPIHPATEIAAALIGGLCAGLLPDPAMAVAGAVFGWLLLTLALLDLRHMWLPDRLVATLVIAGLAAGIAGLAPALDTRLIGGLAAFLFFLAIRHGYRRVRGREGMGGGDVKLFGAIGLWLGWLPLPHVLLGAAAAGLLYAAALAVTGRRLAASTAVPFGFFLSLAAWGIWLWQAGIVRNWI